MSDTTHTKSTLADRLAATARETAVGSSSQPEPASGPTSADAAEGAAETVDALPVVAEVSVAATPALSGRQMLATGAAMMVGGVGHSIKGAAGTVAARIAAHKAAHNAARERARQTSVRPARSAGSNRPTSAAAFELTPMHVRLRKVLLALTVLAIGCMTVLRAPIYNAVVAVHDATTPSYHVKLVHTGTVQAAQPGVASTSR